jgi:hypothetical protein
MPRSAPAILTGSRHLDPLPAVLPAFLLAATVHDTSGLFMSRAPRPFAGLRARINEQALTSLTHPSPNRFKPRVRTSHRAGHHGRQYRRATDSPGRPVRTDDGWLPLWSSLPSLGPLAIYFNDPNAARPSILKRLIATGPSSCGKRT